MRINFFLSFAIRLVMLALVYCLVACTKTTPIQKLSGSAQGTTYHISFWSQKVVDPKRLSQEITTEFSRLDQQLSNYRPDSVIEQFNATLSDQPQEMPQEMTSLVEQARQVSVASQGCYDVTIKPLFDLWGFNNDQLTPPSEAVLAKTLATVGFKHLELVDSTHLRKQRADLRVDLSSIGQGYSVSQLAGLLEQHGIQDYLVEIGGELQTKGKKPDGQPWRIALEKPLSGGRMLHKVISIKQVKPLAVMTSGTYRHYFDVDGKRYSHILDARTGKPITHHTVSVSVLHHDPTEADAWSTALLCLGRMEGLALANQVGLAALFIEQDNDQFNEFASEPLQQLSQEQVTIH